MKTDMSKFGPTMHTVTLYTKGCCIQGFKAISKQKEIFSIESLFISQVYIHINWNLPKKKKFSIDFDIKKTFLIVSWYYENNVVFSQSEFLSKLAKRTTTWHYRQNQRSIYALFHFGLIRGDLKICGRILTFNHSTLTEF